MKIKFKKPEFWTIALLILIIFDSIFTVYLAGSFTDGSESNPLIVKTMEMFELSLSEAMVLRIFYCLPFLFMLNISSFVLWSYSRNIKRNYSKIAFLSYIGIYFIVPILTQMLKIKLDMFYLI